MANANRNEPARYTFGQNEPAAKRLETIAEFFNPHAKAFVMEHVQQPVSVAVDLGCGPGFTTEMLRQSLGTATIYGLDISDEFLFLAERRFPHCRFLRHDATRRPFSIRADVAYERFLLPHLVNAIPLINGWVQELNPRGLLLIDEMEAIETELPVFCRYLEVNTGLIASQGADLFVGAKLDGKQYDAEIRHNTRVRLPVANHVAASWFYPNTVTVWEKEKFVLDRIAPTERRDISEQLAHIRDSRDSRPQSTWVMRRMVLKRG